MLSQTLWNHSLLPRISWHTPRSRYSISFYFILIPLPICFLIFLSDHSFIFGDHCDREALAFSSKDSLRLLVPFLPIQNPQLRSSIYGEALREFIEAQEFSKYLEWIRTWPSAIYEIKQQMVFIRQAVDRLSMRNKSRYATCCNLLFF